MHFFVLYATERNHYKAGFLLCWTLFAATNRRILWWLEGRLEGKSLSYLPPYKSSSDVKTKATYDALREGLYIEKLNIKCFHKYVKGLHMGLRMFGYPFSYLMTENSFIIYLLV